MFNDGKPMSLKASIFNVKITLAKKIYAHGPSGKNIKKRKIVHKGRDRESDLRLKIKWSSYAGVNEVSLVALADEVRSDFLGGLVGFTARVRHGFGNEGDDDRLVRHVHA